MNISSLLATKSKYVVTIAPEESIADAVALLSENNIGVLIVTEGVGKVVGIISERDIVRLAASEAPFLTSAVADVMTTNVIVGVPEDDVMSVAHTMTEKRFRHIPIMDAGRLIGIVSIGDIVKAQRDQYRGEIDTLEIEVLDGEDS
jgi:CBS domain-containing protein